MNGYLREANAHLLRLLYNYLHHIHFSFAAFRIAASNACVEFKMYSTVGSVRDCSVLSLRQLTEYRRGTSVHAA